MEAYNIWHGKYDNIGTSPRSYVLMCLTIIIQEDSNDIVKTLL